jgi:hypothetical protein
MERPALSLYLAKLPFEFLHWWFLEAPITLLKILKFIFLAFVHLFSFKELFTTFFRPWKNEYREGLVRTAILVGVVFKSILIFFELFLFSVLLIIEGFIFLTWVSLPLLALLSLYGTIFA